MAAFLASLRVFSHVIGPEEFDDYRQNGVLRFLHVPTRFPPALRATHILIYGKTLARNESAALVQCIAAVMEEFIPPNIISNDIRRGLEGARLVFGIVLCGVRGPPSRQHENTDTQGSVFLVLPATIHSM
ncbi:hypothetical protein A1O7_00462 [Cladophialophora yegresii CBS 114405]|uniref:Uncharacterized protein n=1 Tax=Cladophialophora yegresii CBS 114405 TaxID=1182544 RepID=W9WHN3_9EURO|nr:uncharacterized protein A1O7_00462 [Cladophialophora yegresii CBS 114405]EXJ64126.1 hypothetical protein A1O7_00462 [Cladophialophora yegresii CBS 114405]